MSKRSAEWDTKENAEVYEEYVSTFPMYKNTSEDLVNATDIQSGMIVVDLGAGTGATTEAILKKTDNDVEIIAVDQAEAMLQQARKKFSDKKDIEYIVAKGEDVDKVVKKQVDAVICNSAFWQMKSKDTLRAVSNILRGGGVFAFNLPDQFFEYPKFKKKSRRALPYHYEDLVRWGEEVGLQVAKVFVKEYEKSVNEIFAFNQIPVMKRNFVSEEEKRKFMADLESGGSDRRRGEWVYLVFKKDRGAASE